ncbi:MAG: signal recognition particle-docking protein FtsY [Planctomycetota bacterium]
MRFWKKNKEDTPEEQSPESPPQKEEKASEDESTGFFGKLKSGLKKTHDRITGGLKSILTAGRSLDEELIEEVEEQLYLADIGPRTVMRLCEELREKYREGEITESEEVMPFLKERMKSELGKWDSELQLPDNELGIILVAGVNGSGKTTSIGKLAHKLREDGQKVLLAASDTFRAGAVEQLNIWAGETDADIVKNETGDPAAVAFDATDKAMNGDYDVLIVDTAGRVHTRRNLMEELEKISRVIAKKIPEAPHETLLTLDATTGQNGISQAKRFDETLDVTGIILAKLDGTAKGGIVFGMRDQIDIPVKFIGLGQDATDLAPFDADAFVEALFE